MEKLTVLLKMDKLDGVPADIMQLEMRSKEIQQKISIFKTWIEATEDRV